MLIGVFWMFSSVALVSFGWNGVVTTDGWELRPDDLFINRPDGSSCVKLCKHHTAYF